MPKKTGKVGSFDGVLRRGLWVVRGFFSWYFLGCLLKELRRVEHYLYFQTCRDGDVKQILTNGDKDQALWNLERIFGPR